MKIVSVVGVRGSGKTTLTEALIAEFKARGLIVGTAKTVYCPAFHMDRPGSNTDRHMKAGSAVVSARAERETVVQFPRKLAASEIARISDGCDLLLCEGDYELPAVRIVCGKTPEDARERLNDRTVAVSGVLANTLETFEGLQVLHPQRDIVTLADLLLERTPDQKDFSALDDGTRGRDFLASQRFCAEACRGHHRERTGTEVYVDGVRLPLTAEQEAVLRKWAGVFSLDRSR